MMSKININSLANEITNAVKEYNMEIEEGMEKAKKRHARAGAKKLRETSPRRSDTRSYADGWTATTDGTAQVIHNKTKPGLAHLLEKGHAKRGGGRVPGIPHIRPVEDEVIKNYEKDIEKVIRG